MQGIVSEVYHGEPTIFLPYCKLAYYDFVPEQAYIPYVEDECQKCFSENYIMGQMLIGQLKILRSAVGR